MNVNELYRLTEWYDTYHSELMELYSKLSRVLQTNANQGNQQPVEEPLTELMAFLSAMKTSACSRQQLQILEGLGVRNLVGASGAEYVEDAVRRSSYDPATSSAVIDAAKNKIATAAELLGSYNIAVSNLLPMTDEVDDDMDHSTVRIVFRSDASMRNVVDWKNYSKDWHDIIRGVALASNEAPEDVKIKGATNGSLIVLLGATAAVTYLLARIVRDLTGMTNSIIGSRTAWEEFKQKSLVTKKMEDEYLKSIEEQRKAGLKNAKKNAVSTLPKSANGDTKNALESAVEKIFEYTEKGLELDFVAPPSIEVDQEDDNTGDLFHEAREAIAEYQETRDSVLLLENKLED